MIQIKRSDQKTATRCVSEHALLAQQYQRLLHRLTRDTQLLRQLLLNDTLARPQIAPGNLGKDGEILPVDDWMNKQNSANERWHIDSTYLKPWHFMSMLFGKEVPPEGADTEFCDTRLLWEALSPEEQANLEGRTAQHSLYQSRRLAGFDEWSETDKGQIGRAHV